MKTEQKTKLESLVKKLEDTKEEMKVEFQSIFKEASADLFEKYDWLQEISWTQYTPYFNDGDSCEFYVNEEFSINGTTEYKDTLYNECYGSILFDEDEELFEAQKKVYDESEDRRNEYKEIQEEFEYLIGFLMNNEEIALMLFGDHAKVSIQKTGAYVEELEHD